MIRLCSLLAVAAMVFATATPAKAADEAKKKKAPDLTARFKQLDADNNGAVTLEEFKTFKAPKKAAEPFDTDKVFIKLDDNKDGKLSEEEFKKIGTAIRKKKSK